MQRCWPSKEKPGKQILCEGFRMLGMIEGKSSQKRLQFASIPAEISDGACCQGGESIMALITWSDAFSVNIKKIDDQHKCLIELVNRLHDSMKAGQGNTIIGPILSDLLNYTSFHFATEEAYFQQYAYPEHLRHKKEHDDLTQQAKNLQASHKEGKLTISIEVMNFLKDWLSNHILLSDKKYSPFLRSKGLS
jgi:hemerythrin